METDNTTTRKRFECICLCTVLHYTVALPHTSLVCAGAAECASLHILFVLQELRLQWKLSESFGAQAQSFVHFALLRPECGTGQLWRSKATDESAAYIAHLAKQKGGPVVGCSSSRSNSNRFSLNRIVCKTVPRAYNITTVLIVHY